MSSALTPTTRSDPPTLERHDMSISTPMLRGLAAFVVIAAIGLSIALAMGATIVFNLLMFVLFAVLWLSFAAALTRSPETLDGLWRRVRHLPLIVQAVIWLLFLPLMIGLWIWEQDWSWVVRLVLVLGIGLANLFLFLPKSL